MATFIVSAKTDSEESRYTADKGPLSIGRAPDNDIVLDDAKVSRYHAKVLYENGEYFIVDLKSEHGSQLSGTPLSPNDKIILRHSDIISIGPFNVRFHTIDELLNQSFNDITDSDILEVKLLKKVLQTLDKERIPSIEVLNGAMIGKKTFITEDTLELTIGRDPLTDFPIEEHVISRQHARIVLRGQELFIFDLDSKNGTFVNGQRIKEQRLRDGDRIALGTIILLFRNPNDINMDEISSDLREKKLKKQLQERRRVEKEDTALPEKITSKKSSLPPPEEPPEEEAQEPFANSKIEQELSDYSGKYRLNDYPMPRAASKKMRLSPPEMGLIALGTIVLAFALITIINLLSGK